MQAIYGFCVSSKVASNVPEDPRARLRVDRRRRRRRGDVDRAPHRRASWPSSTPRCATRSRQVRRRARDRPGRLPAPDARRPPRRHRARADRRPRLRPPPRASTATRYTQAEMEVLYWGIGMHLGLPWAQNKHGHVLGDVTDQAEGDRRPDRAGQRARRRRPAVPLRRLRPRRAACAWRTASAAACRRWRARSTIHNRLVARAARPRRRALRAVPLRLPGRAGRGRAAASTSSRCSPSGTAASSCRCIPPYIWASQRHPDAPRLTRLQQEALGGSSSMADDPANHVLMELRPGDIQFINNFHVLHGRTAYADDRASRPGPPPQAALARDAGA